MKVRTFRRVMAIVVLGVVITALVGCSTVNKKESLSSGDNVLYKKLENNYVKQVKYEEPKQEEITSAIKELSYAYINSEDEFEKHLAKVKLGMDENTQERFREIAREYEKSSTYDEVERLKKEDENYSVSTSVSITKDCIIAYMTNESVTHVFKFQWDGKWITGYVEYSSIN